MPQFRTGDLHGAIVDYESCLSDGPHEDRLPALSNFGLCNTRFGMTDIVMNRLSMALDMTRSLFANKELAVKVVFCQYDAMCDDDGGNGSSEATARRKRRARTTFGIT
jgi:hypothetical protein